MSSESAFLPEFDGVMSSRPAVVLRPDEARALVDLHRAYPNGCDVRLEKGEFLLREMVRLTPNMRIVGSGNQESHVILEPHSNCHMFRNVETRQTLHNIGIANLKIFGNGGEQSRPESTKALTFACAFYFANSRCIVAKNLDFHDIRQTALHFSRCENVVVGAVVARRLGWSGVSTSGTSNIFVQAIVEEAGRDVLHSGIHMDGGYGVVVQATVRDTSGNGIMLDSAFAPLRGCSVTGDVTGCKRGLSLSGAVVHPLSEVAIRGRYCNNREVGIMVSNAHNVWAADAVVEGNLNHGVLFQGRNGGNQSVFVDCVIKNNGLDVAQVHGSKENWIFPKHDGIIPQSFLDVNKSTLRQYLGHELVWFADGDRTGGG